MIVELKRRIEEKSEKKRESKGNRGKDRIIWSEEGKENLMRYMMEREESKRSIEEEWLDFKEGIRKALCGIGVKGKRVRRGWWDEKCKEKKIEARKELRKWRKKRGEGVSYKLRKEKV